jgi:DNA-binding transcriptional ArsR family regulator
MTKNSPAKSTGAHVSIIAHVTKAELLRYLTSSECGNGFANRFMWLCVKRSKLLPEGGNLSESDVAPLRARLRAAVEFAKGVGEMVRDDEARAMWHAVYTQLSEAKPGLLGAVTSRAEAHVTRLSCIYALLDRSPMVKSAHLEAAIAFWQYAEDSARFIFGDALGDPVADEILKALKANKEGMTRTDIRDLFGRNKGAQEIARALDALTEHGLVRSEQDKTNPGRPAERWFSLSAGTTYTTETT